MALPWFFRMLRNLSDFLCLLGRHRELSSSLVFLNTGGLMACAMNGSIFCTGFTQATDLFVATVEFEMH